MKKALFASVVATLATALFLASSLAQERSAPIDALGLKVLEKSENLVHLRQDMKLSGFGDGWLNNDQLFIPKAQPGDHLALELPLEKAGRYQLFARFTLAPDYGRWRVSLDGQRLTELDLYQPRVVLSREVDLGTLTLTSGAHRFSLECVGTNNASTGARYGGGLDYVRLEPAANAQSNRPELALQIGHTANAVAVFSPNSRTVASGSYDSTVKLWDAQTGTVLHTLLGHDSGVTSIAFSNDGKLLATTSWKQTILWDVERLSAKRILTGHINACAVGFSPDGKILATGGSDRSLKLWDLTTGALVSTLNAHDGAVRSLAFSSNGNLLTTGSDDKSVRIWDWRAGTSTVLRGHTDRVWSVAFSPDATLVASASFDRTIRLWETRTGMLRQVLSGHTGRVYAVGFSPDGKVVISGGDDRTVRLWDASTGALNSTIPTGHAYWLLSAAYSPDGETLVTTGRDGDIKLWDSHSFNLKRKLDGLHSWVHCVAFSPDGRSLICGTGDNHRAVAIEVWDVSAATLKRSLKGHSQHVRSVAFSPDGTMIASGANERRIILWDAITGSNRRTLNGHEDYVNSVAFSPDSKTLASGSSDFTVKLWEAETGTCRLTLPKFTSDVNSVAFSPNGKTIVVATGRLYRLPDITSGSITLWDAQTGQPVRTLDSSNLRVAFAAFSPDGKTIADATDAGAVRLWDAETGRLKHTLSGHSYSVRCVAFSPHENLLASGSSDSTVRLWDTNAGRLLWTAVGHRFGVSSIAFSPDGRVFSSVSPLDSTVRVWEAKSGRELVVMLPLPTESVQNVAHDYLIVTPEGYYDGSPAAARYIKWRIGNELFPVEAYDRVFHRPSLVRKALRGEAVPASDQQVQKFLAGQLIPPQVTFTTPRDRQEVTGNQVTVAVTATDDRDVGSMELLVNGRLIAAKGEAVTPTIGSAGASAPRVQRTYQFRIPLPPGERNITLKAIATNEDDLQGWGEVHIIRRDVEPAPGDLHVLAVGVSRYRDAQLNAGVKFAASDAEAFAAMWKRVGRPLYRDVKVITLLDEQATTENVRTALDRLAGLVTPTDSVMLFVSGHGMQREERDRDLYYFATHETQRDRLAETALPWTVFREALGKLSSAKRVVVFLDTCHSGNSLGAMQASNDHLVDAALLKRAMVFASSRGPELSYELEDQRHGAFTTALLEGIGEGKADLDLGAGRDGNITAQELLVFLQARVAQLTKNMQTPISPLLGEYGEPFPLAKVKR